MSKSGGNAKYEIGDYAGALADFNRVMDLYPLPASLYYNRGNARYQQHDYPGAIADYAAAIAKKPMYANALFMKGIAEIEAGQPDRGCRNLQKAGQLGHREAAKVSLQICK